MQAITPYLNFNGNASEALDFYANALGGNVVSKMSFGDMPPMEGQPPLAEDWKNKVMHAVFVAGSLTFMVSDIMKGMPQVTTGSNIALSLNFTELAKIEKVYAALSSEATITMPLQDTFWGARFGMLTDKFGINWMFNYDYPKDK